jgi:hypothetical protein
MITEPLNALLSKKATIISRLMFNVSVDRAFQLFYQHNLSFNILAICG